MQDSALVSPSLMRAGPGLQLEQRLRPEQAESGGSLALTHVQICGPVPRD